MSKEAKTCLPYTKEEIQDNKKKPAFIARFIQATLPNIIKSNDQLYIYNNKYYDELTDKSIKDIIYKFLKDNNILEQWRTTFQNDIIGAIKHCDTIKTVKIDDYNNLINLNNGIYNLDTFKLIPHSEDYHFSYIIDASFIKGEDVKTPYFNKFLSKLFTLEDGKPDTKTIANICRLGGYLLYPQNKIEKMFLFLGEGANGKSVLIEIFKMFFDKKFITSLNLHSLSAGDKFTREALLNSKINITTEQKASNIDSEEIKKIISGEDLTIDRKFRPAINFAPKTKLIIASNTQPRFNDTTRGLYRRLMIFEFKNEFKESEDEYNQIKNPEKKGIFKALEKTELLKNLKKEINSILKIFLTSLKDLKNKNWVFPTTKNTTNIMNEYTEISDKLGTFLKENYEEVEDIDIEKSDNDRIKENCLSVNQVMAEYKQWYIENISEKKFYDNIGTIGKKIKNVFRCKNKRIKEYNDKGKQIKTTYYPINYKDSIIIASNDEELDNAVDNNLV